MMMTKTREMTMSKQYLLLCDDNGKTMLEKAMRSECVQFLEIQGMTMSGNGYNILVTPVLPPVNPMPVPPPPAPPPVEEKPSED